LLASFQNVQAPGPLARSFLTRGSHLLEHLLEAPTIQIASIGKAVQSSRYGKWSILELHIEAKALSRRIDQAGHRRSSPVWAEKQQACGKGLGLSMTKRCWRADQREKLKSRLEEREKRVEKLRIREFPQTTLSQRLTTCCPR